MKFFIINFSPASYYFFLLRLKIVFSTLSKSLSLCSSLSAKGQFSNPYQTTGKIIVKHILTVMFFGSKHEDKRFWNE
jgi:hypothetical protein